MRGLFGAKHYREWTKPQYLNVIEEHKKSRVLEMERLLTTMSEQRVDEMNQLSKLIAEYVEAGILLELLSGDQERKVVNWLNSNSYDVKTRAFLLSAWYNSMEAYGYDPHNAKTFNAMVLPRIIDFSKNLFFSDQTPKSAKRTIYFLIANYLSRGKKFDALEAEKIGNNTSFSWKEGMDYLSKIGIGF